MAKVMEACLHSDIKNMIAFPIILESTAVISAPPDFVRILETGGVNFNTSCLLIELQKIQHIEIIIHRNKTIVRLSRKIKRNTSLLDTDFLK